MKWGRASQAVTVLAALVGLAGLAVHRDRKVAAATAAAKTATRPLAYTTDARFAMAPTVDQDAPLAGEEKRRVLALYDSSELVENADAAGGAPAQVPQSTETALAHRLAELPLLHLGLVLDFLDVDKEPLPSPAKMARYRGVLSWFGDNRMRHPDAYLRWLVEQLHAGRKVVVMEGLGAYEDLFGHAASPALVDEVLTALGARWLGEESSDSSEIHIAESDPRVMAFEAPMPSKLDYYAHLRAAPSTKVYCKLERAGDANSLSDAVWTSPAGGFALPTLVWREDKVADRWVTRWLVDPFAFFAAAFALDGVPRVDFTTLNGERIFYSQVDGDGLDTISELDYSSPCGAIVRDRIFEKYDLPFTASVVVGFTAPPPMGKGNDVDVQVARSIFALPNVEVGSHGWAHPLNWRAPDGEVAVAGIPNYTMSGDNEIAQSVAYIDRELAPPGKRCRIMLWTGDCNPTAEHLAVAYRLGLRNLNGGDPRMDAHYPSYAHLVPPVHRVGGLSQYYTSAANDYILTDEWKPPFYRFRNVLQTFARAGAPRRVVPVDVYFHFYSARNLTALTALEEIYDWVVAQPLAPMFASEYVDVVRDAAWARLARSGVGEWTIVKGPSLRTLRFDDEHVHVDLSRSRGVLGYVQEPALHATYVHLDGGPTATIALGSAAPATPYLERASHWVDDAAFADASLQWTTHGPGRRTFVFAGLAPGARYRWPGGDGTVDAGGRLAVIVPGGPERVRLVADKVQP